MTARNAQRTNTPTEQNKENQDLILYRLTEVEHAVKELSSKFDKQDTIKKTDFTELKDTIISRITEIRTDLQKQIDGKADKDQVDDLRSLVKAVGAFLSTVMAALIIYYITHK